MRHLSSTNLREWENEFSHYCKLVLLIIGKKFPIMLYHSKKKIYSYDLLYFCLNNILVVLAAKVMAALPSKVAELP